MARYSASDRDVVLLLQEEKPDDLSVVGRARGRWEVTGGAGADVGGADLQRQQELRRTGLQEEGREEKAGSGGWKEEGGRWAEEGGGEREFGGGEGTGGRILVPWVSQLLLQLLGSKPETMGSKESEYDDMFPSDLFQDEKLLELVDEKEV
eukprot:764811-Hanusia_phi.AAC.8